MNDEARLRNLEIARQRQREMKAAGIKRPSPLDPIERAKRNPQSKALALRAYYFHWVGLDADNREQFPRMRREYQGLCADAAGRYAEAVKENCLACVGDEGPRTAARRIRECRHKGCQLHGVRPYQVRKTACAEITV